MGKRLLAAIFLCLSLYAAEFQVAEAGESDAREILKNPFLKVWGKGLSLPLLKKVEERAIAEGKSTIRLIVANTSPGLIRLYEAQGYALTGDRLELSLATVQPQYLGQIHCLHMEKRL